MKIQRLRPYRLARVTWALLKIMPRYFWLNGRGSLGLAAAPQASWDRVHHAAAREIRAIALELAGAYTKAAQIYGARADILPDAFIQTLSQFHDRVPPRPFAELLPIVERNLGKPIGEVFAHVDPEAIAAASLAQVHRATLLPDAAGNAGAEVVLKIQYPEIRHLIPSDLGMLRRAVWVIQRLQSIIDLHSIVREVTRFIELELDFAREVDSTERLGKVLEHRGDARVPRVYRALCGPELIVLEYIEGIQVTHTAKLEAAGHKLAKVARRIGDLYGAMIFELGFFHGDPHPGNLLVMQDGTIALLDFGLCKELPEGFARNVARMMVAAMVGRSDEALEAAAALGFETKGMTGESLRSLMLMVVGDSDTDEGLLEILGESQVSRVPEDFALVVRTMILLNGLSHRLTPKRRLLQAELIQHLAAGAAAA